MDHKAHLNNLDIHFSPQTNTTACTLRRSIGCGVYRNDRVLFWESCEAHKYYMQAKCRVSLLNVTAGGICSEYCIAKSIIKSDRTWMLLFTVHRFIYLKIYKCWHIRIFFLWIIKHKFNGHLAEFFNKYTSIILVLSLILAPCGFVSRC